MQSVVQFSGSSPCWAEPQGVAAEGWKWGTLAYFVRLPLQKHVTSVTPSAAHQPQQLMCVC